MSCNSCIPFKCIQYFYKFSNLVRHEIGSKDNITIFVYEGEIFKDRLCTKPLGKIFVEQTVNSFLKDTVTNHTAYLPDGVISYRLFHKSTGGKPVPGEKVIGPFVCGNKKYLHWNSSKFFSEVIIGANDDLRTVNIYKNKC